MDKRYQIFVSSTYEDLQDERREVMNALLELDSIPAGMELFPAADEDQWSLIKRVVDDCDYYLVIIAGRYGSAGPDGMGYTEKEYRYALDQKKPIIAFLHRDPETLEARRTEKSADGRKKLEAFRSLAKQKMCKYWSTPAELGSVVSRSLVRLIKTSPAVGWVRADALPDKETSAELLGLRKRVDELEKELEAASAQPPKGTEAFAQGEDPQVVHYAFQSMDQRYKSRGWSAHFTATWNEIFSAVSPLLIDEARESRIKEGLDDFARTQNDEALREDEEFKGQSLGSFSISEDDFQTIKVQLRALGLITKSVRQRSVKDTSSYWTLTPYGDAQMVRLRAIRRSPAKPRKTKKRGTKRKTS